MRFCAAGSLVGLLVLTQVVASQAHAGEVTLAWSPPTQLPKLSHTDQYRTAFLSEKVRFEIADKRDEGHVVFDSGSKKHSTQDDVASFYATHFIESLSRYGVQVVEKGETVVIRASVRKALVTKASGPPTGWEHVAGMIAGGAFGADQTFFNGEFIVLCDVHRKEQTDFVWAGQAHGRYSLPATADVLPNYQVALSGAVLDAARALLEDPDLLEKLVSPPQKAAPAPSDGPRRKPVAPIAPRSP